MPVTPTTIYTAFFRQHLHLIVSCAATRSMPTYLLRLPSLHCFSCLSRSTPACGLLWHEIALMIAATMSTAAAAAAAKARRRLLCRSRRHRPPPPPPPLLPALLQGSCPEMRCVTAGNAIGKKQQATPPWREDHLVPADQRLAHERIVIALPQQSIATSRPIQGCFALGISTF